MGKHLKFVRTRDLNIAFSEAGPVDGWPVVLSHGFPYDIHAYDAVVPALVAEGARVITPYLRGFGPTRFLSPDTMRSGQQSALGRDVIALIDALEIERAILAGYDWGGLASCVATLLWPERVTGLVSMASYDVIDVSVGLQPCQPELEHTLWYQHYFQTARGKEGFRRNYRSICQMLWHQWSPNWNFSAEIFEQTAASYDNPDFVNVVLHHYRWAFGLERGDPELDQLEAQLALLPLISVPSVTLDGTQDPLKPSGTANQSGHFAAERIHKSVAVGHNLPQEAPEEFAAAIRLVRELGQSQ